VQRDEFCGLPTAIALGLIYDLARAKLEPMPMPRVPLPPKFDGRLGKTGGFIWMSEMDLGSLEWWLGKKTASSLEDNQYAERNAKTADTLAKWVEWRKLFPDARWNGTRGDQRVTAEAPSREPKLQEWSDKKKPVQRESAPPPAEDDDYRF
jgi:hypothetical protein